MEEPLAYIASHRFCAGRPTVAGRTPSQRIAEVRRHAHFGRYEAVAISKRDEHLLRGILDLVGGDHIVVPMEVAVKELRVVEVILALLPCRDIGRIANQFAMLHDAEASHTLEGKHVRVHGGKEQAGVIPYSVRNVARACIDVGSHQKRAR